MRILAIDYGDARVGLALSDPMGWTAQALSFSPIRGPEGNMEFLVHILPKGRATHSVTASEAEYVVRQAHESLRET